jgi:hypothetical protein
MYGLIGEGGFAYFCAPFTCVDLPDLVVARLGYYFYLAEWR